MKVAEAGNDQRTVRDRRRRSAGATLRAIQGRLRQAPLAAYALGLLLRRAPG
jgi:hypothetical protein